MKLRTAALLLALLGLVLIHHPVRLGGDKGPHEDVSVPLPEWDDLQWNAPGFRVPTNPRYPQYST